MKTRHNGAHQRGATMIELAFVLVLFFMFLLGVTDVARMLFTWNAATEATRAGARYAVVCADPANQGQVLQKMRMMVPEIGAVALAWEPSGCDATSCAGVTVTVTGLQYRWLSPVVGAVMPVRALPSFSTYLPREMMRRDPNNAVICQ
ncbi:pilus assembly protein [Massilia antarctica]|uniref:Pilus assembly protein n=1 Tax=Massilia antarctica TaxID=2765360 RepID=A0AA49AAN5_9BURK|nr:TadE/TadG family type IV pilus assembly protein [Massilia antarctica]QPI51935.1 pilus assembly protein [Massilia antarctica]